LAAAWNILSPTAARADEESKGVTADAAAVLTQAATALSKAKVVQYTAEYSADGWVTSRVPAVNGSVVMGPKADYDVDRFRLSVSLTPYESKETASYTAGCDGDTYYLSDAKTKTVYADMDPAVMGSNARDVQRVLLRNFSQTEDWMKEELDAQAGAVGEEETVGGEPCHRIDVTISDRERRAWFFAKSDLLPRRVDRIYLDPDGKEGVTRLVIKDLKARSKLDLSPFKVEVPAGFTKTDQFAP
jgi:hypothetical protein